MVVGVYYGCFSAYGFARDIRSVVLMNMTVKEDPRLKLVQKRVEALESPVGKVVKIVQTAANGKKNIQYLDLSGLTLESTGA